MATVEPERLNIGQLLLQAFWWFDRRAAAALAAAGDPDVKPSHVLLYAQVDEAGTRSIELARRLGVSRQAVHQTVTELEQEGLVARVADPSSRSAKLVRLTAAGRRHAEAARRAYDAAEEDLAGRLGPDRVAELRRLLERDWGDPEQLP